MVQIRLKILALILAIALLGCSSKSEIKSDLVTANVVADVVEFSPNQTASKPTIPDEKVAEKLHEDAIPDEKTANRFYGTRELVKDLERIFNISYYNFTRDREEPEYIKSSELKYYVIRTGNEDIGNFEEFCGHYCGPNWNGFRYFINNTIFNLYIPILGKENFSTESAYKDYIEERVLANYTRKENVYRVRNGKVLEYKFWLIEQDESGNFEGSLMPYLLVYKIPCTPNMTVFIRPKWEKFSVGSPGKVTQTIINWEMEDDRVRAELLNKSIEILEACGVKSQFFDDHDYKPYFESGLRAYYYKTHYMYFFNLTSEVKVGAQRKTFSGDDYLLKEINVSFANKDEFALYDVKFRIDVMPDGEREQTYYETESPISALLEGKSINRSFNLKDITFVKNITITATLYTDYGKAEIRPITKTFIGKELVPE